MKTPEGFPRAFFVAQLASFGTRAVEAIAREGEFREHPAERRRQPRTAPARSRDRRAANGADLSTNNTSGHEASFVKNNRPGAKLVPRGAISRRKRAFATDR